MEIDLNKVRLHAACGSNLETMDNLGKDGLV